MVVWEDDDLQTDLATAQAFARDSGLEDYLESLAVYLMTHPKAHATLEDGTKAWLKLRSRRAQGRLDNASECSDEDTEASEPEKSGSSLRPPPRKSVKRRLSAVISGQTQSMQHFITQWAEEGESIVSSTATLQNLGRTKMSLAVPGQQRAPSGAPVGTASEDLNSVLAWDFDVLASDSRQLVTYAVRLLEEYNDFDALQVDKECLLKWVTLVQENYHESNAYHNFKHAFNVMCVVLLMLSKGGVDFCTDRTQFAILIGALAHDIGHPGFNNDYLVKSRHPLAIRYNDGSVLEQMHASVAFELLLATKTNANFAEGMDRADFDEFRKTVIFVILATDMKVHFELVDKVQALAEAIEEARSQMGDPTASVTRCMSTCEVLMDRDTAADRTLVLKSMVHASDVSNPVLPMAMARAWAYRVVLEFHAQAQQEKSEGLPFAPFMEPHPDETLAFAKLQVGFIAHVVKPYWVEVARILPDLKDRLHQLDSNLDTWKQIQADEEAKAAAEAS